MQSSMAKRRRSTPAAFRPDGLARALNSVTINEGGPNWFPMIVASDERKCDGGADGRNRFVHYYEEKAMVPH